MIYTIQLKNKDKYIRRIMDLFDFMAPFCNITGREMDVLSELIYGYIEFEKLGYDEAEIFTQIFSYEYRRKISNELISRKGGTISMEDVDNYISKLRKKKILFKNTIVDKYLNFFKLANSEKEFTFVFEFKS